MGGWGENLSGTYSGECGNRSFHRENTVTTGLGGRGLGGFGKEAGRGNRDPSPSVGGASGPRRDAPTFVVPLFVDISWKNSEGSREVLFFVQ